MAAVREMIVDIQDPEMRGLLREFGSPVKARPPTFGRGDSGPRRVRLVEPTGLDRRTFKDADTTGYAMEMAVGSLDAGPTAGTYTITRNSLASASIAYNASGAALETALEGISGFPGTGVTVTKYGDNAYEIRFNANGAQAFPLVAGTNLLEPDTGIYLTTMQEGSVSTPTILWLRLLQGAIAYQNTWDAYPTGSAVVETLVEGSATQKEIVRISLDQPAYDGSILITTGTAEKYSITVTQSNAADALDDLGFILFDLNGSVGVYFDGTPDAAILATDRQINVNTLTTGDSKATVATKLATALAADSTFTATANGNAVKVTLENAGDTDDPVDVDSTFTFSVTQAGTSISNSVPINASARDFAAAMDNLVTVTKSGLYQWDLKFRDYGNQSAITVDASALFPMGYEGDLNFITRQCFRAFQATTEPFISPYLEISLTPPGSGPFTVLHMPVTVVRDIITTEQQASATLPSYFTTAEGDARYALKASPNTFTATQTFSAADIVLSGNSIINLGDGSAISASTTGDGFQLSLSSDFGGSASEPLAVIEATNAGFDGNLSIWKHAGTQVASVSVTGVIESNGLLLGSLQDPVAATKYKSKAGDTVRNSGGTGTTLTVDPDLIINIGANQTWAFEFHIYVIGESATPDWKGGLTFPSAPTAVKWSMDVADYDAITYEPKARFTGDNSATSVDVDSINGVEIIIRGEIQNGANAGSISLLWAQNTSSADDMTVQKCSYAIATLKP